MNLFHRICEYNQVKLSYGIYGLKLIWCKLNLLLTDFFIKTKTIIDYSSRNSQVKLGGGPSSLKRGWFTSLCTIVISFKILKYVHTCV